MRLKILFCLTLLFGMGATAHAQSSPYSNVIFKAQTFTATGQTGTPIQLNGLTVSSTVGSSFASGTITVTGSSLTTVTFGLQGSGDGGATYYALPLAAVASPGTTPTTTVTATGNGLYQVNLAGLTHVRFVTSGTFTATNVSLTLSASPNATISRNGTSGGASLPTAAHSGQIMTSIVAGTTYAAQGQIFYQQATDTIASIETECSPLCTYHVTSPQTFTLAADHTLSPSVQLAFDAGGLWTLAGGHTLTIAGGVTGGLTQHFAGATVKFGTLQAIVPAEWFGAIGDCNTTATSCTDNSATIQAALNSLTAGQVLLQPRTYEACGLTITASDVGMKGAKPQTVFDPNWSRVICNNTSATTIAMSGPGGGSTTVFGNILEDVTFSRYPAPTGTATGVSISFVTPTIRHVTSEDSYRNFYMIGAGSIEMDNDTAQWGINGFSIASGSMYGFYFDGSTGFPSNSARIIQCDVVGRGTGSAVAYGLYSTGSTINDMWGYLFNTNGQDYGVYINYTGTGALDSAADIQFIDSVLDFSHINAIHVAGLNSSLPNGLASIEFTGGWADNAVSDPTSTTPVVDIESSTGVTIQGMNIADQYSTSAVYLNSSTGNVIAGNNIRRFSNHGIELNNSNNNAVNGNVLVGGFDLGTPATHHIHITGTSSYNNFHGNAMSGNGTVGIYVDTSTAHNTGIEGNTVDPTNIAAAYSYVGNADINNGTNTTILAAGINHNAILGRAASGLYNTFTMNGDTADTSRLGFVAGAAGSGDNNWYNDTPAGGDTYWRSGSLSPMHLTSAGYLILTGGAKPPVYTVATLPSAATAGAGAIVSVSDASSFTVGTCTGGGSDVMLAVSNGSTWSCH